MLHEPSTNPAIPEDAPIFDHFIVVGLTSHATGTYEEDKLKILYKYPVEAPMDLPGLEDFCFPRGVLYEECVFEGSNNLRLQEKENSFVFLLQNAKAEIFYGTCLHSCLPSFAAEEEVVDAFRATIPRAFCIISRYPFFKLHFDVICRVLAESKLSVKWNSVQCASAIARETYLARQQCRPTLAKVYLYLTCQYSTTYYY